MPKKKQTEEEVMDQVENAQPEDQEVEILAAFDSAVAENQDEDEIKMSMIGAGATFKNVTRLYNKFMIDAGLAVSKADRDEIVQGVLEGRDLSTEEGFDEAVAAIIEAVNGSTDRSAAGLIRSYGRKNELEVFKKAKGTGAGRSSFASKYYEFIIGNPGMDEDEAKAYVMGEGDHEDTSDNVKKHLSHYLGIWKLANTIHNA